MRIGCRGRADADRARARRRIERRRRRRRRERVAGGADHEDARVERARDRTAQRRRRRRRRPAEAEVDHLRAVRDGPVDAGGGRGEGSGAGRVEDLHRQQLRRERDARDADAVVRDGSGDAGDLRSVPGVVVVLCAPGGARARKAVRSAADVRREVGVRRVDARVENRDRRAGEHPGTGRGRDPSPPPRGSWRAPTARRSAGRSARLAACVR